MLLVGWSGAWDDGSSLDRRPSTEPFAGRLTSAVELELDAPGRDPPNPPPASATV